MNQPNILAQINLNNADIATLEQSIYNQLNKIYTSNIWSMVPIAPLAEPMNLNALVGSQLNGAVLEIQSQATNLDTFFTDLNNTNNNLKTQLTALETLVTQASTSVHNLTPLSDNSFLWLTDNFKNTQYIDSSNTTALIDTDYGQALLTPTSTAAVAVSYDIDQTNTTGIPGCNMLVLTPGNPPTLSTSNSTSISNLSDGNSSTWFEIERNFVIPTQPLSQVAQPAGGNTGTKTNGYGGAWVYNPTGTPQDVLVATSNLDWNVSITWTDGTVDSGAGGQGIPKAEFKDISNILITEDNDVTLILNATLTTPSPVSLISINPYVRASGSYQSAPIYVSIDVLLDNGSWINVAKQAQTGSSSNNVLSNLTTDILKSTNTQTVGSIYSVPTNRPLQSIKFTFTSSPVSVAGNGLAHQFASELTTEQSSRNDVLFTSTDTWQQWQRVAVNSSPQAIVTTSTGPNIFGSIATVTGLGAALGSIFAPPKPSTPTILTVPGTISSIPLSNGQPASLASLASNVGGASKLSSLGGTLGQIGGVLSAAAPVLGIVSGIAGLLASAGAYSHTTTAITTNTNYDVFTGWRAAIGLIDMNVLQTQYGNDCTVQSVQRTFPAPVSSVGIFAEENIPSNWGTGDWVDYYLSSDGITWTQVQKLTSVNLDSSYVPSSPITSVYYKAIIHSNTADTYHTPSLTTVSLMGKPA